MIIIEQLGFRGWPSARSKSDDLQNADIVRLGDCQNITGLDLPAGSRNLLLVNPDIARCHKFGSQTSGFGDSGKPEPFINA